MHVTSASWISTTVRTLVKLGNYTVVYSNVEQSETQPQWPLSSQN